MRIELASINFKNSSINEREKLAFTDDRIRAILHEIKKDASVRGCVLLATCNRTELYLSRNDGEENIDNHIDAGYGERNAGELLLQAAGVDNFDGSIDMRYEKEAVFYLTELASGLKSQILGEGQIATQINMAWQLAKEEGCTDAVLNVLFRDAVAAGKEVLTKVKISAVPLSSAYAAFDLISRSFDTLDGKKAVVIGNGNMGHLMQELLHEQGCEVMVTIRGYSHGNNTVVDGCRKIAYSDRYRYMEAADLVVSATKSPHHTVRYEDVRALKKIPELMVDLAMPRDIESKVTELCTVKNINELGFETKVDENTLNQIYIIIDKKVQEFYHWYSYEASLKEIDQLKAAVKKRVTANIRCSDIVLEPETEAQIIELAVDKTINMLLGGMHECVDASRIRECTEKIEKRTR